MVEGGKTPVLSVMELDRLGYRFAIFPSGTLRAPTLCLQQYYGSLKANGIIMPFGGRMVDFVALSRAIGMPEMLEPGKRYDE